MHRTTLAVVGGIALAALLLSTPLVAQTSATTAPSAADMAARLDALARQVEQQRQELDRLRAQVAAPGAATPTTCADREMLARMIREEIARSDALRASIPGWLDGLTLTADVRIRYEGQFFQGHTRGKTTPWDYNRERVRARVGFVKEFSDEWTAALRVSTGSTSDPTSSNATLTGDFTRKPVSIDQGWIQYRPRALGREVAVVAGKFANLFVTTEMLWDPEVMPEGLAESWTHKVNDEFSFFATMAQLWLQDNANSDVVALLAYQLGIRYKLSPDVAWRLAAAFYQYCGVDEDTQLAASKLGNSWENGTLHGVSGPFFSTLGKQDFQLLDLFSDLTFLVGPSKLPLRVYGQVTVNMNNTAPRPWSDEHLAFIAGASLGQIKRRGDWEIGYNYRRVQANAIVAAFVESAFGGTDRQGHTLAFRYAILDNITFGFKYVLYDWIVTRSEPSRSLVRAEVEVKF